MELNELWKLRNMSKKAATSLDSFDSFQWFHWNGKIRNRYDRYSIKWGGEKQCSIIKVYKTLKWIQILVPAYVKYSIAYPFGLLNLTSSGISNHLNCNIVSYQAVLQQWALNNILFGTVIWYGIITLLEIFMPHIANFRLTETITNIIYMCSEVFVTHFWDIFP